MFRWLDTSPCDAERPSASSKPKGHANYTFAVVTILAKALIQARDDLISRQYSADHSWLHDRRRCSLRPHPPEGTIRENHLEIPLNFRPSPTCHWGFSKSFSRHLKSMAVDSQENYRDNRSFSFILQHKTKCCSAQPFYRSTNWL
jgi:hypothetical protein